MHGARLVEGGLVQVHYRLRKEKLTWDAKEDVVIDPFGNGADAFCTEDVKGRISGFTIDAPS